MIVFWLLAAVLILAVYGLFWWSLRHPPHIATDALANANVVAHRQRRKELEQELAEGKIDRQQFDQLIAELDRDLLDLLPQHDASQAIHPFRGIVPVFIALGMLPLAALALYFSMGRPDLLSPSTVTAASPQATPSLEAAIAKIKQRLRDHPDDLEGWVLLARSYQATGQPKQALTAFRNALALAPEHPDLQVRYAEALAQTRGGDLSGEPQRLLQTVLRNHPDHPYALWLAGMAALQQDDRKQAQHYWQKLLAQMPADSKAHQQMVAMMQKAGLTAADSSSPKPEKAPAASIRVTVTLAPKLIDRARPDDPVFIFARAASGPPMPLAIVRKQVKDLPVTVTLDDSMAMLPKMKLSRFPRIVLGARVAKSGDVKGAPGDLEGWTKPVFIGQDKPYTLVIDQVRS